MVLRRLFSFFLVGSFLTWALRQPYIYSFIYMKIDKYPVIVGETAMVFEFVSTGIRGSVPKLVVYSETHLHDFYNLGFGDKDEETGNIDDEVITNNGDSEKVLATVA